MGCLFLLSLPVTPHHVKESSEKPCLSASYSATKEKKDEASRHSGKTLVSLPPEEKHGEMDLGCSKCDHHLCL